MVTLIFIYVIFNVSTLSGLFFFQLINLWFLFTLNIRIQYMTYFELKRKISYLIPYTIFYFKIYKKKETQFFRKHTRSQKKKKIYLNKK